MKVTITWNRLEPDTVRGECVEVKTQYTSFVKQEVDDIQKELEKSCGFAIVGEYDSYSNKEKDDG